MGFISSDLRRKTPFTSHEDKTYFGRAMAIVQSTRKVGTIRLRFDVEGWDEPVWVELTSEALPKDYVSDIPSFSVKSAGWDITGQFGFSYLCLYDKPKPLKKT